MSTVLTLNPTPGFCVKSKTLQAGSISTSSSSQSSGGSVLGESTPRGDIVDIPEGLKVFINIAWDANVPPPPEGIEVAIQKAFSGIDDAPDMDDWYVPVVISDGRQEKDKAGKLALVFDAVFNSSLKPRTLDDQEFKVYIIELALQRIELQMLIPLSRELGFPNIASKGKLGPRSVRIPNIGHTSQKKLIEELQNVKDQPPTISGRTASTPSGSEILSILENPRWLWSTNEDRIVITLHVPKLTRSRILESTLDLEDRRILFHVPSLYSLDINLSLSDAELIASASGEFSSLLALKRMRNFDTDGAKAQWNSFDEAIVLTA